MLISNDVVRRPEGVTMRLTLPSTHPLLQNDGEWQAFTLNNGVFRYRIGSSGAVDFSWQTDSIPDQRDSLRRLLSIETVEVYVGEDSPGKWRRYLELRAAYRLRMAGFSFVPLLSGYCLVQLDVVTKVSICSAGHSSLLVLCPDERIPPCPVCGTESWITLP